MRSPHGERVVLQLHVDVLVGEAGEIGAENVLVGGLDQVHRRQPPPADAAAARDGGLVEEGVEEPVHLVLDRVELGDRLPANQCHANLR